MTLVPHPAKWSKNVLTHLAEVCGTYGVRGPVLDPFAGRGAGELAGTLGLEVHGVELEPEWAEQAPNTVQGDALALPYPRAHFGAVVTSPPYANRMADRLIRPFKESATYVNALQRQCSDGSTASLQWSGPQGDKYREMMVKALAEMVRVVDPAHGFIIVNVKDHVRAHERQGAVAWYVDTLKAPPFSYVCDSSCGVLEVVDVPVRGYRFGENSEARVTSEAIIVWHTHARSNS